MNQLIVIAIGGSVGALLRFFVSNGMHMWLGRGFPFGTLTVNVLGSFLIGLLTEALVLQRVAISMEYRAAILVGLFGSFTTFSTFSLETVYLIEQGNFAKAGLNAAVSVLTCILAVWLGLLIGRTLFFYSDGVVRWFGLIVPYGIVVVNAIGSFLIGILTQLLFYRVNLSMEHRAAILVILLGAFTTLSSLYLILYLIEEGHSFKTEATTLLSVFIGNAVVCIFSVWLGSFLARQL